MRAQGKGKDAEGDGMTLSTVPWVSSENIRITVTGITGGALLYDKYRVFLPF